MCYPCCPFGSHPDLFFSPTPGAAAPSFKRLGPGGSLACPHSQPLGLNPWGTRNIATLPHCKHEHMGGVKTCSVSFASCTSRECCGSCRRLLPSPPKLARLIRLSRRRRAQTGGGECGAPARPALSPGPCVPPVARFAWASDTAAAPSARRCTRSRSPRAGPPTAVIQVRPALRLGFQPQPLRFVIHRPLSGALSNTWAVHRPHAALRLASRV